VCLTPKDRRQVLRRWSLGNPADLPRVPLQGIALASQFGHEIVQRARFGP
jgi:hypothetical protein